MPRSRLYIILPKMAEAEARYMRSIPSDRIKTVSGR